LKQVLLNLAGNALKFTEKGQIAIRCEAVFTDDHHTQIKFMVKDTGIGIPTEKQSTIFNEFVQADDSTTRKYGGTGLGITISKQLVELMGGILSVASTPGQGSTFWFNLTFDNQTKPSGFAPMVNHPVELPVLVMDSAHRYRILLVDDYPTNQKVACMHLTAAGYEVDIAENGREAVDAFKRTPPDLILMDIQMPVMDGYQAAAKIRALESKMQPLRASRVPIIAMTARAFKEDEQRCRGAGMDDFIAKPIRRQALLQSVTEWIPASLSTAASMTEEKNQKFDGSAIKVSSVAQCPIDLKTAIEEFGDKTTVLQVTAQLLVNIQAQIDMMTQALRNGDFKQLQRESHAIKGGAGTVEAHPLAALAAQIETSCRNHDKTALEPLFDAFLEEFRRLKAYLWENQDNC
jgi:CheY-like chemotaxis protein/HPt (histidine-containing phosphotransfer) domain-containing protein